MADVKGDFTTGSQVVGKAGSAYSVAFNPFIGSAIKHAEGTVNAAATNNYSLAGSLDLIASGAKGFLSDISSSLVAVQAITFDIGNYTDRIEAEDMINVNRDIALRGLSILRVKNVQDFLSGL